MAYIYIIDMYIILYLLVSYRTWILKPASRCRVFSQRRWLIHLFRLDGFLIQGIKMTSPIAPLPKATIGLGFRVMSVTKPVGQYRPSKFRSSFEDLKGWVFLLKLHSEWWLQLELVVGGQAEHANAAAQIHKYIHRIVGPVMCSFENESHWKEQHVHIPKHPKHSGLLWLWFLTAPATPRC